MMTNKNESLNEMVDEAADPQPDVSFVVNTEALERITSEEHFERELEGRADQKK